ncbi:hypothetical protein BDV93DRAFT_542178 [Ceratobasidium sp. AG-I]|nr:hypothetical protein BDV93DRAFT_542178 [Ceratobasidium sp. AG-I]
MISADSPPQPESTHQPSSSTGAQDVWFYMAEAESQTRPSDGIVAELITADAERQTTLAFHSFKKPKSTRIRCVLCLSQKNEWRTWLNRVGGISRPLREHLSKEHSSIYNDKCTEQGVGLKSGARSSSVAPAPQAGATTVALAQPQPPSRPPSQSQSQPQSHPQPQYETPPGSQHPPQSHSQPQPQAQEHPSYSRSHRRQTWDPERRKSALELAQEAMDVASRPRSAETVEELRAELEQVKAQRDHEVHTRRLLEQELHRMKEASRARDEELLKVSHLISASLHALAGGAVSGPPPLPPLGPPGPPQQAPAPHPQVMYPYPYPYPYPYHTS